MDYDADAYNVPYYWMDCKSKPEWCPYFPVGSSGLESMAPVPAAELRYSLDKMLFLRRHVVGW
jgi:hypothetical protein